MCFSGGWKRSFVNSLSVFLEIHQQKSYLECDYDVLSLRPEIRHVLA